jgi:hypothetical protein
MTLDTVFSLVFTSAILKHTRIVMHPRRNPILEDDIQLQRINSLNLNKGKPPQFHDKPNLVARHKHTKLTTKFSNVVEGV